MVFNSLNFTIFFSLFFFLYWFVFKNKLKLQNILLLVSSYAFLAWTDWRLLIYLIAVSIFNFILGIYIEKSTEEKHQRILVRIGVLQGVGGLFYFKYFNFFISQFNDVFQSLNINFNLQTLNILVPLGISFFTFKTLSYILDIDKEKIKATKDWVVFFNYIAFFPTLLSGPIDRADTFVPQLEKTRKFNFHQAVDGSRQILWGLFKKIVIADNLATVTGPLFDNYQDFSGSTLLYGAFFYTIQLYTDFSGYSDMAIGFARLIGFKVTKNFDFPFFAQNIAEFWRKWHISLTSWMTEYLFTPLSFILRDLNKSGLALAIIINFVIIGIWHGANWTFLLYGLVHGLYFVPLIFRGTLNKRKDNTTNNILPSFKEILNILLTFSLVLLANIIFRSDSIEIAFDIYNKIFSKSLFSKIDGIDLDYLVLASMALFLMVEWLQKTKNHGLEFLNLKITKRPLRWFLYFAIIILIISLGMGQKEFIYFQF